MFVCTGLTSNHTKDWSVSDHNFEKTIFFQKPLLDERLQAV